MFIGILHDNITIDIYYNSPYFKVKLNIVIMKAGITNINFSSKIKFSTTIDNTLSYNIGDSIVLEILTVNAPNDNIVISKNIYTNLEG
jgi:hypothetical protein